MPVRKTEVPEQVWVARESFTTWLLGRELMFLAGSRITGSHPILQTDCAKFFSKDGEPARWERPEIDDSHEFDDQPVVDRKPEKVVTVKKDYVGMTRGWDNSLIRVEIRAGDTISVGAPAYAMMDVDALDEYFTKPRDPDPGETP